MRLRTNSPTPEVADQYLGAEILLPIWNQSVIGCVVAWSWDTKWNIVIRNDANLILDTRLYQAEFTRGKVTWLTTDTIAWSIYAQCDEEGNEYDKAISLSEQQISIQDRLIACKSTTGRFSACERTSD